MYGGLRRRTLEDNRNWSSTGPTALMRESESTISHGSRQTVNPYITNALDQPCHAEHKEADSHLGAEDNFRRS